MSNPKRKLAAIVFTDIVGFTKLTAKNQSKASSLLKKQRELFRPIIESFNGEWIKEMGDGLLLTFDTVTDAVNCCIKLQDTSKKIDDLVLRIGIHQGEILLEENDIIGDDVNVAARIEPFSAPGGIAISNKVHDAIIREEEFETKYIGKPKLKGVGQEVKVYCITSHGLPETKLSEVTAKLEPEGFQWNFYNLTGAVLTFIGILFWINISFLQIGISKQYDVSSIAIVPLANKGKEKDDFYAYGISNDLISTVSSRAQLIVSSMNDFENLDYKNLSNNDISKELNARYVLRGTLWRMADVFQLSLELFDATIKKIIWADNWQTKWEKLAEIKNEITDIFLDEIDVNLNNSVPLYTSINPVAYELYLKADHQFSEKQTLKDIENVRSILEEAIQLDDKFMDAKNLIARTYLSTDENKTSKELFENNLEQSETLNDDISKGKALHGLAMYFRGVNNFKESVQYYDRALELQRNIGDITQQIRLKNGKAWTLILQDKYEDGLKLLKSALNITKNEDDLLYQYNITRDLAWIYYDYKRPAEFDSAYFYTRMQLELANRMDSDRKVVEAQRMMGNIFKGFPIDTINHDTASFYFLKALELSKKNSFIDLQIYTLSDLAYVVCPTFFAGTFNDKKINLIQSQDLLKGLAYDNEALDLALSLKDNELILSSLRQFSKRKSSYEIGLYTKKLEDVLKIAKDNEDDRLVADILSLLGSDIRWQNKEKALEYFNQSLDYETKIGNNKRIYSILQKIVKCKTELKEWDDVFAYLDKSLINALLIDDSGLVKNVFDKKESVAMLRGDINKAVKVSMNKIDFNKKNGIPNKHSQFETASYYFYMEEFHKTDSIISNYLLETTRDSTYYLHDYGVSAFYAKDYEKCIKAMEKHLLIMTKNPEKFYKVHDEWYIKANMSYILASKKMLGIDFSRSESKFLQDIIDRGVVNRDHEWFRGYNSKIGGYTTGAGQQSYDNHIPYLTLYLLTEKEEYLKASYSNLMDVTEFMDEDKLALYMDYPIQRTLTNEYNQHYKK